MYDRRVDVPRLRAVIPDEGIPDPLVEQLGHALSRRYDCDLGVISMALYRHGQDSVAFHADKVLKDQEEAIIAIVVLGEPRPFQLRPKGGGRSMTFKPGWGDLLVMGGRCQRAFEHGVPKVSHAGPRMAVMFRAMETMG
jgi:alkylated DNA repair dioxygenase AlkB